MAHGSFWVALLHFSCGSKSVARIHTIFEDRAHPLLSKKQASCALKECGLLPVINEHCLFRLINVESPQNQVVIDKPTGKTLEVRLFNPIL